MKVDVFGSRNFNSTALFLHAKNIAEDLLDLKEIKKKLITQKLV